MIKKKKVGEGSWFRKTHGNIKDDWGFIPISWKGFIALVLLIGVNIFAARYFNLNELALRNSLEMGAVFFLSIFIFIEIAKSRTIAINR